MKSKLLLAITALLMIQTFAFAGFAQTRYYGSMMVDNCENWVSLRKEADTGSNRLAKVPLFGIVTDAQWDPEYGDFIRCSYDGQFGYILARYLIPWADPEPNPDTRFDSEMGFSFDYDSSLMTVDADSSESGQSLILYAMDTDQHASLEIINGTSEFPEEYDPSSGHVDEEETESGTLLRWYVKSSGLPNDTAQVFYTAEKGDQSLAAVGICPGISQTEWIAQFNAVMQSLSFEANDPILAEWAESSIDALVIDQAGEYVMITANEPLTDVSLLGLKLSDSDAPMSYNTKVIFEQGTLRSGESIAAKIAFPGDTPCYGIRFVGEDGRTRQYAIGISGRDGSLQLEEF